MSTERAIRRNFTEQIRLEVTLSNGHKVTVRSTPRVADYHNQGSRRNFIHEQHRDQRENARACGLTVASVEVFKDMTEVVTVERTYTKTELMETRSEK